jgi:hypothetical protein
MTGDEYDVDAYVLGAAVSLREASAWISTALTLLNAIDVRTTVLPDLNVWLADLSHELDPTHKRVPEEMHRAPESETE